MSNVIVVTVENKGDGSGNFTDYFRPGVNVFTNQVAAAIAIAAYLKHHYDDDIPEGENEDLFFNKKAFEIVEMRGYDINGEDHYIRVEVLPVDPPTLKKYDDWKKTNFLPFSNIKTMLERGEMKTFAVSGSIGMNHIFTFTTNYGQVYQTKGQYNPATNEILPPI